MGAYYQLCAVNCLFDCKHKNILIVFLQLCQSHPNIIRVKPGIHPENVTSQLQCTLTTHPLIYTKEQLQLGLWEKLEFHAHIYCTETLYDRQINRIGPSGRLLLGAPLLEVKTVQTVQTLNSKHL